MDITPVVKVGGENGTSIDIEVKGPGSRKGLEREVKLYVTIEGGPDSYGMVSLL